ncbi:GAF domain-containing protein [Rhodococcus sp. BS-15]|uniref:GAF domain-containing protein n=1 Tax=Rhodococcus sp. BS-15 TaxID=1304954 RepID=UPI000FFB36F7|nr:GAF domain-containing protein [Rhodococcus sp. BS-15]
MAETSKGARDWMVAEILTGDPAAATLVYEGAKRRDFTKLSRRSFANHPTVLEKILEVISEVAQDRTPRSKQARLPSGDEFAVQGVPIHGGTGEVFGVQLWVGRPDESIPPRRTVGTFCWNARTDTTVHGNRIEEEILGMTPAAPEERVIPQIFRFFEAFDKQPQYLEFVGDLLEERLEEASQFGGQIDLRGEDHKLRRVYMTVRSSYESNGPVIRGLVHDISDVEPPQPTSDRQVVRETAALMSSTDRGIGLVDLRSGIITEWLAHPREDLDAWASEVPQIHPGDQPKYETIRQSLSANDVRVAELILHVRFAHSDWIPVDVTITAVGREGPSQGLIQVGRATPEDLMACGPQMW